MRNYFVTANKIVANFEDAATALKSGFVEPIELSVLADEVFEKFTLEFWEGSPSEGWSVRQINDELADFFGNPVAYVIGILDEEGYACTPVCIEDIVFEVTRRLRESGNYKQAEAFVFEKQE